jgi:hypothetical protein
VLSYNGHTVRFTEGFEPQRFDAVLQIITPLVDKP